MTSARPSRQSSTIDAQMTARFACEAATWISAPRPACWPAAANSATVAPTIASGKRDAQAGEHERQAARHPEPSEDLPAIRVQGREDGEHGVVDVA